MPFHECATDKKMPRSLYAACFVVREENNTEDSDTPGDVSPDKKPAGDSQERKQP
jgi:hypothetical protein